VSKVWRVVRVRSTEHLVVVVLATAILVPLIVSAILVWTRPRRDPEPPLLWQATARSDVGDAALRNAFDAFRHEIRRRGADLPAGLELEIAVEVRVVSRDTWNRRDRVYWRFEDPR